MACREFLREEFRLSNFKLHHDEPHRFVNAQWNRVHSVIYVLYRWVTAIYLFVVLIYSAVNDGSAHYLIYLTNWTFLLLTFSHVVRAVSALYWLITRHGKIMSGDKVEAHMPWYLKFLWTMFNTSGAPSLAVTILYWAALYATSGGEIDFINFATHGSNSIIVVLDQFVTSVPMRVFHVHHPMIYGILYSFFSGIYYAAGGKTSSGNSSIYSVLNFEDAPGTAVLLLLGSSFVAIPLLHFALFGLYKFRLFLYEKCCPGDLPIPAGKRNTVSTTEVDNPAFVV